MMDTTIIYNDYLSGDAKALERLMEIYGDKLTLYINGYIKNLHDSEDLLIEVFAYLISKRPNIKSSFESYIYKAARNHALMFLRKAKRHRLAVISCYSFGIALIVVISALVCNLNFAGFEHTPMHDTASILPTKAFWGMLL